MTNEQLAAFIKQGGNEELIPILWERIRKLMYMKSDRVYSALQSRFNQCGYDVWDLKQSCYTAFLKAIEGSVTGQDISLFALRYRFFSGSTGGFTECRGRLPSTSQSDIPNSRNKNR